MYLNKKAEVGALFFLLVFNDISGLPRLLENIVSIVYYALLLYAVFTQGKKLIYVATKDIFLLSFIVLAIVSVVWSSNTSATIDSYRFLIRTCLLGVYIAMRYTPKEQMRLFFWTYTIIIIASFIMIVFVPSYGITPGTSAWKGIYSHKQTFGRNLGLAISFFLINFTESNKQNKDQLISAGLIILTLILMIFSQSKTSLIMLAFSLSLMCFFKFIKRNKYGIILLMSLVFVFSIITIFIGINYEYILVDVLGKDVELNGRLPLWQLCMTKGLEQPWLGYGYEGFWTSSVSDYVIDNTYWTRFKYSDRSVLILHAHNGVMDVFLQMGLVGLLLFISNIFNTTKRIVSMIVLHNTKEVFWMLQFLGIYFISNLSESDILSSTLYSVIYVAVGFSCGLHLSRIQKNDKYSQT